MLLIAPRVDMLVGSRLRKPTVEEVNDVFERGLFPTYVGSKTENVDVKEYIAEFLRSLTQQTYELVDFLGIAKSRIPAIVFFEKLALPSQFVLWDLRHLRAHVIAIQLRPLLDRLTLASGPQNR